MWAKLASRLAGAVVAAGLFLALAATSVSADVIETSREQPFGMAPYDVTWDGLKIRFWTYGMDGWTLKASYYDEDANSPHWVEAWEEVLPEGEHHWTVENPGVAGHRVQYMLEARDPVTQFRITEWLIVEHAIHVELGPYGIEKLAKAIAEAMTGPIDSIADAIRQQFTFNPGGPGYQRMAAAINALENYGPMGEVKQATSQFDSFRQAVVQQGAGRTPDDAATLFRFPLRLPDGTTYYLRIDWAGILRIQGWEVFWQVTSACLWGGFLFYLVKRLAPKTGV